MNNPLQQLSVAFFGTAVLLASGCASAPSATDATRSQKSAAEVAAASGKTVFTEEKIAALMDDDFWGSGAKATVDEEGRLTYLVPTEVIGDGNYNDMELAVSRGNNRFYYIDQVTGRPIAAVDAWQIPGAYDPRQTSERFSGPGPTTTRSVSPRSVPRSVPRSAPVSRGTRSTQDDRN